MKGPFHEVITETIKGSNYKIKKTTYYLQKYRAGLKIEELKFTLTKTVELRLVYGDDYLIQKNILKRTALKSPRRDQIETEITNFVEFARTLDYYKE